MERLVIIDNGHGAETPGKCSPDGRVREWEVNRDIARRLAEALEAEGLRTALLVPGDSDTPLNQRVREANALARKAGGADSALLVSVHCNAAAADGKWHPARGFASYVGLNASKKSKELASDITTAVERAGYKVRRPTPGQGYWVQNLAVCRDTVCPAVLVECFFMDNRADAELLLSGRVRESMAGAVAKAVSKWASG